MGKETVFQFTVRHKKELPETALARISRALYDLAAIGGDQVEIEAKAFIALEVKE